MQGQGAGVTLKNAGYPFMNRTVLTLTEHEVTCFQ
jgi:hypothetical protein